MGVQDDKMHECLASLGISTDTGVLQYYGG